MLYFELLCGASGDMILSSLIDLGVPLSYLNDCFRALQIPGLSIVADRQSREGRSCTHLSITWSKEQQREMRNLAAILELINRGRYDPGVVETSRRILHRLAGAESTVHRVPVEQVHFHEIGAIDTVIDVLGFALAIGYLGVNTVLFSTLTVGSGTIETDHGTLSVPAPATEAMLTGFRVKKLDTGTEILTPTGCAILTAGGLQVLSKPAAAVRAQGFGCGQKRIAGFQDYLSVTQFRPES